MESGKKNLGFPDDLAVKNPNSMQETWVRSLHWEHPLEKKMATHPSVLAWKLPWTDEPAGGTVHGVTKESRHDSVAKKQQQEKSDYFIFIRRSTHSRINPVFRFYPK